MRYAGYILADSFAGYAGYILANSFAGYAGYSPANSFSIIQVSFVHNVVIRISVVKAVLLRCWNNT